MAVTLKWTVIPAHAGIHRARPQPRIHCYRSPWNVIPAEAGTHRT
jgi:hypothetical protein